MRKTNKIFQQLVAQLLLSCFLLESCSTPNMQIQPKPGKTLTTNIKNKNVDASSLVQVDTDAVSNNLANNQLTTTNSAMEPTLLPTKSEATRLVMLQEDIAVTTRKSKIESVTTSSHGTISVLQHDYSATPIAKHSRVSVHGKCQLGDKHALAVSQKNAILKRVANPTPSHKHEQKPISCLKGQVCMIQGGYQVSFEEKEEGELQGIVEYKLPTGFTRQLLPAKIAAGLSYSEKAIKSTAWQKQHIHVINDGVYVGKLGLMGGGKDKKKQVLPEGEKEERNTSQQKEGNKGQDYDETRIEKVQEFIEKAILNTQQAKGKEIVLLLGRSGSGKSTITNYLLQCPLILKKNKIRREWLAVPEEGKEDECIAKIGQTYTSETFFPLVCPTKNTNYTYCDCPGFEDTRTASARMNTTIATQLVVNAANSIIGIIVVIPIGDFNPNLRGEGIKKLSLTLTNLLKNLHKNSANILFVFNDQKSPEESAYELSAVKKQVKELEKEMVKQKNEKEKEIKESAKMDVNDQIEADRISKILSVLDLIRDSIKNNRACVVDIVDNYQSKGTIEKQLAGILPTPKTDFGFNEYDKTRVEFSNQLVEVVEEVSNNIKEYLNRRNDIKSCKQDIKSCDYDLAVIRKQLKFLDFEKGESNTKRTKYLKVQEEVYKNRTNELKKNLEESNTKLKSLKEEIADLNTDEAIIYSTREVDEQDKKWYKFLKKTHTEITYEGVPLVKRELSRPDGEPVNERDFYIKRVIRKDDNASVWDKVKAYLYKANTIMAPAIGAATAIESIAPEAVLAIEIAAGSVLGAGAIAAAVPEVLLASAVGSLIGLGMLSYTAYKNKFEELQEEIQEKENQYKYKADYYSAIGQPGRLKVSFYIKKKDKPENQARIRQIECYEMHQQGDEIKAYKEKIDEAILCMKIIQGQIAHHESSAKDLQEQGERKRKQLVGQMEKKSYEKKFYEGKKRDQEAIRDKVQKYLNDKTDLMDAINNLILYNILNTSNLMETFQRNYEAYNDCKKKY